MSYRGFWLRGEVMNGRGGGEMDRESREADE